jgi:glycosyltransferase involved in cell wall biosynthesis
LERSLSALLPVCNAQSTLPEQVSEMLDILPELTRRFELVLIDDGSSDATIEVADELAVVYPQLVIARHAVSAGRAAAIRTGLVRSVGEIIFLADAPCALALDEVRTLWRAIGDHELVLGKCRAWHTQWGFGTAIPYTGGYLLGRRRAVAELAESLEDDSTLLAQLRRSGRPWHEVEVSPRVPSPARTLAGVRRLDAIHAGIGPRDRANRLDEGEHPPGRQQRPNYLTPLGEITEV